MNLYLRDCEKEHGESKENANTNLKMLKLYGFTFDYKRHVLSIAGLIHLKGFCTSGEPVPLFDQLNSLIDYMSETPYNQKDIHDLKVNVNLYYEGNYNKCLEDIKQAFHCASFIKHHKLKKVIKRLEEIVDHICDYGEESPYLLDPLLLR